MSVLNGKTKNEQREQLERDIAKFTDKGGKVTKLLPRKARRFERPNWHPTRALHPDGHDFLAKFSTPLVA